MATLTTETNPKNERIFCGFAILPPEMILEIASDLSSWDYWQDFNSLRHTNRRIYILLSHRITRRFGPNTKGLEASTLLGNSLLSRHDSAKVLKGLLKSAGIRVKTPHTRLYTTDRDSPEPQKDLSRADPKDWKHDCSLRDLSRADIGDQEEAQKTSPPSEASQDNAIKDITGSNILNVVSTDQEYNVQIQKDADTSRFKMSSDTPEAFSIQQNEWEALYSIIPLHRTIVREVQRLNFFALMLKLCHKDTRFSAPPETLKKVQKYSAITFKWLACGHHRRRVTEEP